MGSLQRSVDRPDPILDLVGNLLGDIRGRDLDQESLSGASYDDPERAEGATGHVRDNVIGSYLDRRVEPILDHCLDGHGDGGRLREDIEGRGEALIPQHSRIEAMRDIAQIVHREAQLGCCLVDPDFATGTPINEAEPDRERDQMLLGAVMQIPFQLPPVGVAGLYDTSSCGSQGIELRTRFRLEPFVVEADTSCLDDLIYFGPIDQNCSIVFDEGHLSAFADDRSRHSAVPRANVHGSAVGIYEVTVPDWIHELQVGIAKDRCEVVT